MSLSMLKLMVFNESVKRSRSTTYNAMNNCEAALKQVINEQSYARSNPDGNIQEEYLATLSANVDELAVKANSIISMLTDIQSVRAETMTIDELITKYNVDLGAFSNSLVK